MKLIDPSVELMTQPQGIEGIYKHIEEVARTCYKSGDKITEDSAEPFVNRLIKSKHLAMCEHATVYMEGAPGIDDIKFWQVAHSPYSKVVNDNKSNKLYVTSNLRVLIENNAMELLNKYLCEPTEHHAKRITLKFITSIGVSREANRHRSFSVAEMSTRYCNFSKDKFNNEIRYIKPIWHHYCFKDHNDADVTFRESILKAENDYMLLIKQGWKPQQAREVLPLCTATEVVYTAFEDDWRHFFDLRYRGTTGAPHPNMLQVATMAHDLILDKLNKDL